MIGMLSADVIKKARELKELEEKNATREEIDQKWRELNEAKVGLSYYDFPK
jgi:hypothetical protein